MQRTCSDYLISFCFQIKNVPRIFNKIKTVKRDRRKITKYISSCQLLFLFTKKKKRFNFNYERSCRDKKKEAK